MGLFDLDPFEIAWVFALGAQAISVLIVSIFFQREAIRNKAIKGLAHYYQGMMLFFLFLGINGIFDFLEQYAHYIVSPTPGVGSLFPPEYQVFNKLTPGLMNTTTFCIIISLLLLSFGILSYQLEKDVFNYKHRVLSVILFACCCVSLVAYFTQPISSLLLSSSGIAEVTTQGMISLITMSTLLPFAIIIGYWGVYYLVFAKRTMGSIRRKAILVAFGIGFIMAGIIFDIMYRSAISTTQIFWLIPLVNRAVGVLGVPMLFYGFRREQATT